MKFTGLLGDVRNAVIAAHGVDGKWRPVGFNFLRDRITSDPTLMSRVIVWREPSDIHSYDARYTLFDERESQFEEPVYVAQITYCSKMDEDPRYLLYALVKELMHSFDPPETWTDTPAKLDQFLRDLQNKPLERPNGAISVELKARWMALLALIPPPMRDYVVHANIAGRQADELGQELGLPDSIVASAIDDYYLVALERVLKDDEPPVEEPAPDPNLDG